MERKGWKVGNANEFLGLSNGESRYIGLKLQLGPHVSHALEAARRERRAFRGQNESARTMLNRAVLILRYQQPFVDWINAADPSPTRNLELADVNHDNTAYLVEVEDEDEFERWLKANAETLFEEELNGWYTDPNLWPQDRSLALFKKWCSFELHTLVMDTGGSPLFDDEIDN